MTKIRKSSLTVNARQVPISALGKSTLKRRGQIKFIIILLTSILFYSCSINRLDPEKKLIKGFNSEEWKKDSLSCDLKRPDLYKILLLNKDVIINKDTPSILLLLGKPNVKFNDQNSYAYFVEYGSQCSISTSRNYEDLQTKALIVDFKNNKVVDLHIVQP